MLGMFKNVQPDCYLQAQVNLYTECNIGRLLSRARCLGHTRTELKDEPQLAMARHNSHLNFGRMSRDIQDTAQERQTGRPLGMLHIPSHQTICSIPVVRLSTAVRSFQPGLYDDRSLAWYKSSAHQDQNRPTDAAQRLDPSHDLCWRPRNFERVLKHLEASHGIHRSNAERASLAASVEGPLLLWTCNVRAVVPASDTSSRGASLDSPRAHPDLLKNGK
eukprot:364779-Chlamydomonas_euryale.AAC.25